MPVTVISVALIAATIQTETAATAVTDPGLARIVLHRRKLPARWKPASHADLARVVSLGRDLRTGPTSLSSIYAP